MDFQFPSTLTASQKAQLNALGNLAYMYMGMATEGGRMTAQALHRCKTA